MSTQHTQYVLLFLVLGVDSDWFQILRSYVLKPELRTQAARSYVLLVGPNTYAALFPYPLPDFLLQAVIAVV